ncbi:MAG: FecR family protein [Acidobacteriia bacterium]|nr:FecR family protein [Terriglobia bacterium]
MNPHVTKKHWFAKMTIVLLVFSINCFYVPTTPLYAAATPIGQMVVSGTASPTKAESTVFNGDVVSTSPGQAVAITLKNAGLLNVAGSSQVRLEQDSGNYKVELTRGEVLFSSPKLSHEGLKIRVSGVEISIPAASAARGKVLSTPEYILVSSLSGDVQVASNGRSYAVSEGDSSMIPIAAVSNGGSTDQKPDNVTSKNKKNAGTGTGAPAGSNGFFGLGAAATAAIVVGIGVGAGVIIWQATKSESSPSRP